MAGSQRASDYPIADCLATAIPLIESGADIYQKFTCEKCGSRQTMERKNVFFEKGKCEECNHVTDIKARGCNYVVHALMKRENPQ
jgi:hypothetical protein